MNAFRESVEAMIPALRRYARALTRDADIADDLVQDTLVRALRSERLFLGGDIRSWLYTILTNLNRNRRARYRPRAGDAPGRTAFGVAAGDAGRAQLSRSRQHPGRADRHRDVTPRPRPCPRQNID
jgi:DNA-directed RNA polymerase specialized sigma24 family protein